MATPRPLTPNHERREDRLYRAARRQRWADFRSYAVPIGGLCVCVALFGAFVQWSRSLPPEPDGKVAVAVVTSVSEAAGGREGRVATLNVDGVFVRAPSPLPLRPGDRVRVRRHRGAYTYPGAESVVIESVLP
jgi:hypothetical protein